MLKYKFSCGCEFDIVDPTIKPSDNLPSIDLDLRNLAECQYVWNLFSDGNVKGVFQLESQLGHSWSKKIKPSSIEEISALIALIRPGSLQSIIDGRNMPQIYADRKNGLDEVTYFISRLEPILKDTYGVFTYQEQALRIATELAGFSLQEADSLRKAMGKKDPELMSKVEKMFLEKAKQYGILSDEDAKSIFGWIREAQRYSFNKCLNPNTLVELEHGELRTIEEVEIGSKIKAPSENGDVLVEIIEKHDNGEKELYEITLESGKTIQCTLNHKFLCEDGQIRELIEIIENEHKIICQDD